MNKITFEDLRSKGKEIIWNKERLEDGNYKVTITFDHDVKKSIIMQAVPGQYTDKDGVTFKEKPELKKEDSEKLVDSRIQTALTQLQQAIFTFNYYGGKIDGFISSGEASAKDNSSPQG